MSVFLFSKYAMLVAVALAATSGSAGAAKHYVADADVAAKMRAVMFAYQDALNACDIAAATRLYSDDAVLMPENSPSVIGKAAIQEAYAVGSKLFALHVKFTIGEIVQIAPSWGFVRTNSAGTMKIIATGATLPEANQELFILHREPDGQWRIARYAFSTTNSR